MQEYNASYDLTEQRNSKRAHSLNVKMTYWINMIVLICLYVILMILLLYVSKNTNKLINFKGIIFNSNILSGIIAQGQVMISVGIVLIPIKKGYLIALGLNIIQAAIDIIVIAFTGTTESVPGIFVAAIAIIIITIIEQYAKRLNKQIEKVTRQKEKLRNLYEKDLITGKKLRQQNQQLIRYNKTMKEKEKTLHHIAFYDMLTDLPNRKMIIDKLDLLTDTSLLESERFIFVVIDLDNFKTINDTVGHSVGDAVLNEIVKRWKNLAHKNDILARFGGDGFAILIQRALMENELLAYIESYQEAISKAIYINQKEFHLSFSCGITSYPQDGSNTTELLKNADITLYNVKSNGKNDIQFYKPEMQGEILKRIQLEDGLQSAIRNGELYVVFQPLYSCNPKILRGFEVLARWHSKELGMVSPMQFIPIAEETGIIIEIGKWILQTALEKVMHLQQIYPITPIVSINVSVIQMIQPSFVAMVKKVLEETGFDSRCLELEITESVFISYPDHIIEVLNELKALGIQIALDDFGTGYASLSYLQMLPINTLKIDKTFIDKIPDKDEKKQIVGNIIELAHQLGFEVVAEGVEQEAQLQYLTQQKCDYIQGYLFSKPLSEEELQQLIGANL